MPVFTGFLVFFEALRRAAEFLRWGVFCDEMSGGRVGFLG